MRQIYFFFILFFMGNIAWAQNTIALPLIINYSKSDYHAGAQTWSIAQDKNGLMYFANNEGLISFDGSFWKVYPLPNRTILRSIAIENDRIYAGGQGEMGYFAPDSHGFLKYSSLVDLLPKSQNKFADIWDIEILGGSVFFRATDRIFELNNNKIEIYYPKSEWQFLTKVGGRLIAQDKKFGLLEYKNHEWLPLRNNQILDNHIVSGITSFNKDKLLVTTIDRGFFLLNKDSLSISNIHADLKGHNTAIFKTLMVNSNELAVATTSEGCTIINLDGTIKQNISRSEGLQNNNVLCVFMDKDSNLWVGLSNGISMIAYNAAIKYIMPDKVNEAAGFSSRILNNHLYIGTSDGGYFTTFSTDQGDIGFSKGNFQPIGNSDGQVWRLDEVNQHLLMAHNSGTYEIENDKATQLSSDASWLFLPISTVQPSRYVLAGTYKGLKLLEYTGNRFVDDGNLYGTYESFRFLVTDNNGSIWSSHPYRGIYKIELSADKKKYSSKLFTDKDGLPSSLNNHVFKIKNRVVFATEKGAYEFDDASKKFIPSAFLWPIFGNIELRYLTEDADGNIWFCSGKKIGVVHFTTLSSNKNFQLTYFPELTGQILSGFENIYPYNSENIFIGSEKGIIHLNYKKYASTKTTLSTIIGNVRTVGNIDSAVFGGYMEKTEGEGQTEHAQNQVLHLPSSFSAYHFEFSSPNYSIQKSITYSYKLEGFDNDWSSWAPKTEKDYTNLGDGNYTFWVKSRDNLGNESAAVSYQFVIAPPFYKTIWAYLFYFFVLVTLIYFLKKWQDHRLKIQQLEYEEKQKQIIALHNLEIEKSEKEIIKLQNEKLASEILLKKKELADTSMHLIEREDALARVKEELQKLYKKTGNNHDVKIALQLMNGIEKNSSNWDQFAAHFNEISNDFLKKMKSRFPNLTNADLKVCAYLQLNLSSKEIAQLMNISVRGVEMSRYRIRKKIQIPPEQGLNEFLNAIE
ncbi:MAG: transcriptional regulator [Bacteroidetes bacterium]|nr:transcriptional regulator [Bacteroidota bacterium]